MALNRREDKGIGIRVAPKMPLACDRTLSSSALARLAKMLIHMHYHDWGSDSSGQPSTVADALNRGRQAAKRLLATS
jgi:hypothetical protein